MSNRFSPIALVALAVLAGCRQEPTAPASESAATTTPGTMSIVGADLTAARQQALDALTAATSPREAMAIVNDRLAAQGLPIRLGKMEYVTGGPNVSGAGQVIFANDRELRLDSKWVPGDPRRGATGNEITQISSLPFAPANYGTSDEIDGTPPVDRSFGTWNDVKCSNLDIVTLPPTTSIPSAVLGIGDPLMADIVTIGFLPGVFFDFFLGAGAAENVLGVTFTYWWIYTDTGEPTDIDSNGRLDTALKEVWYNDAFLWSTDETPNTIDIETVALHENGHALELGHYGKIFGTFANLKLHVSPRAVMNAVILGTLRKPLGTDNAAYCGNFASWPN